MLLEMKNIVKTYGNVVANNKVNINLNKGEILAVLVKMVQESQL